MQSTIGSRRKTNNGTVSIDVPNIQSPLESSALLQSPLESSALLEYIWPVATAGQYQHFFPIDAKADFDSFKAGCAQSCRAQHKRDALVSCA